MKEFVGIEPVIKNRIRVEIGLCNICNYNCPYCLEKNLKNRYDNFLDYKSLINFFNKLPAKNNVDVVLCGGEPTLHPNFLDLVEFLKNKGYYIEVVSNGSRRKEWWKEATKYLDVASITFHPTEINIQDFINNVEEIGEDAILNVAIICEPKTLDAANNFFDEIHNKLQKNTTILLKPLIDIDE